jgi:hypothetical protein
VLIKVGVCAYEGHWVSLQNRIADIYERCTSLADETLSKVSAHKVSLEKLKEREIEAKSNRDADLNVSPLFHFIYGDQAHSRFEPTKGVGASAYEDSVENIE